MSEERIPKVYEWSARQTTESHAFDLKEYYWTETAKRALFRTENTKRGLIGLIGLQGTGKSALLEALVSSVQVPEHFELANWKWSRNWREKMKIKLTDHDDYFVRLWRRLLDEHENLITSKLHNSPMTIRNLLEMRQRAGWIKGDADAKYQAMLKAQKPLDDIAYLDTIEKLLGAQEVDKIREGFLSAYISKLLYIFIDMPDYTKNDIRLMRKDIDELQHMWADFMEKDRDTSFIITLQKEIVKRRPHFFFGKIDMLELKRLKPEQLVDAYKLKWQTVDPFTEEALMLVAKLSRGVFRRFLKYVHIVVEAFQVGKKTPPITVQDVEASVGFDVLLGDMELEFEGIFPREADKVTAVKVLQALRGRTLTQKEIAEKLEVTENTIVKIIGKLALYDYVKRTRGERTTWLVELV